jgi:hypothetical protein
MFEKMGSDPLEPSFVKPQNDDVWRFITQIAEWCNNPNRLGMGFGTN